VRVHSDYLSAAVFKAIEASLRDTFSFQRRELAQGVTLSEVVASMQAVQGVEAIDLNFLGFSHERGLRHLDTTVVGRRSPAAPSVGLPALPAQRSVAGLVRPAQHLRIDQIGLEEM
jgi:hypothetical protein